MNERVVSTDKDFNVVKSEFFFESVPDFERKIHEEPIRRVRELPHAVKPSRDFFSELEGSAQAYKLEQASLSGQLEATLEDPEASENARIAEKRHKEIRHLRGQRITLFDGFNEHFRRYVAEPDAGIETFWELIDPVSVTQRCRWEIIEKPSLECSIACPGAEQ